MLDFRNVDRASVEQVVFVATQRHNLVPQSMIWSAIRTKPCRVPGTSASMCATIFL